jgi:hypothetical protein
MAKPRIIGGGISERSCIGMGGRGSAVAEIVRDPSELGRLFRGVSCGFGPGGLIILQECPLDCDGELFGPMW